nr:RNA polymerase II [Tanacetum cinerariifolium]
MPSISNCETSHRISRNLFEDSQIPSRSTQKVANLETKVDMALMSAWCHVSSDLTRENNQRKTSMWARICQMYDQIKAENQKDIGPRNENQMKGRFKRFSKNGSKWFAAYTTTYSRKTSGVRLKDVELDAHKIFEGNDRDKTCLQEPNEESGGSTKRSRVGDEGDYVSTPTKKHQIVMVQLFNDLLVETVLKTKERLLEFTSEYGIPESLHHELPGPEDHIIEFLEDMDLFSLISAPNPAKVRTRTRPRASYEVPLLTATTNRVIDIEDVTGASGSSGTSSTVEKSPLDFSNEDPPPLITESIGAEEQGQYELSQGAAPVGNPPYTGVASEPDLEKETVDTGALVSKRRRKRGLEEAQANIPPKVLRKDYVVSHPPQSTLEGKSLASIGITIYKINFDQIYLGKPMMTESDGGSATLFPKEARLRNLTYVAPLYVDVRVSIMKTVHQGEVAAKTKDFPRVFIVKVQIMMRPRMGVEEYCEMKKAYYFRNIIHRLLLCALGRRADDDIDHYGNTRLDLAGPLLGGLFRRVNDLAGYINLQCAKDGKVVTLHEAIMGKTITSGLNYALPTGNQGQANAAGIRAGVSQVLNRMMYVSMLS